MNLGTSVAVTRAMTSQAVGTGTVASGLIDMSCFDGVLFIGAAGTITDGSFELKVQGGFLPDGSDLADLAGTGTTEPLADDNQLVVLDLYRPIQRYLKAVVVRGGATGAVIDGVIALQYGPKVLPTVNDPATVGASNLVISPAVGAA